MRRAWLLCLAENSTAAGRIQKDAEANSGVVEPEVALASYPDIRRYFTDFYDWIDLRRSRKRHI